MPEKKNTIGRFEIIEKIGEGPIGAVYKALDPVIRRTVAIKVIKLYALEETTTFAEVFEKIYRVVRTSTSLNHPNICIIYDLSEEKKIPYITMEYVEGQDIDALLQKKHQFKRAQLLNLLSQVCDALDFAHKKNVIHQDLKTTNILVTPELQVKITDFGIAGLDEIAAAQTKKLLSIPFYISPEQALGEKISQSSDLFSLGVIMYHLLSGELPFRGTTAANVIMTIAKDGPAIPADLEKSGIKREDWVAFFNTALAKSPEERFKSAKEMFDALSLIIPPSDHSYFPYSFSGGETENTGRFEKTFISDAIAAPTVMISAKEIFAQEPKETSPKEIPQEPEPIALQPKPVAEQPEPVAEQRVEKPPEEPAASPHIEPENVPVGAVVAEEMPEPEEGETVLVPRPSQSQQPEVQAGKTVLLNDRTAERKIESPAPPTQLIEIPDEVAMDSSPGSNGNSQSVEPQVPEPSKPAVVIQGTAAVVDRNVSPSLDTVPPIAAAQKMKQPLVRRAAGPPNLKRYLLAAVILAIFIVAVGSYILLRNPKAVEETKNEGTSAVSKGGSRPASVNPSSGNSSENSATANPAPGSAAGKIDILSNPAGAKVLLNGEQKGVTPLQLSDLPPGQYDVQLQLNGYKDLQQEVEVSAQNPASNIQVTLEKATPVAGTLFVDSTPSEAFIVISNRVIGVTPKKIPNMKAGKYNITLKKDGYQDFTTNVRVIQDKTATLHGQLEEIPRPAPVVEAPKKYEPSVKPGELVTIGPGVTLPKPVKRAFAKYPPVAKERKIEGVVSMRILISETGHVINVEVVKSQHELLENAAVAAVHGWVYEPATKEGVPVKVWIPVSMAFQVR